MVEVEQTVKKKENNFNNNLLMFLDQKLLISPLILFFFFLLFLWRRPSLKQTQISVVSNHQVATLLCEMSDVLAAILKV